MTRYQRSKQAALNDDRGHVVKITVRYRLIPSDPSTRTSCRKLNNGSEPHLQENLQASFQNNTLHVRIYEGKLNEA